MGGAGPRRSRAGRAALRRSTEAELRAGRKVAQRGLPRWACPGGKRAGQPDPRGTTLGSSQGLERSHRRARGTVGPNSVRPARSGGPPPPPGRRVWRGGGGGGGVDVLTNGGVGPR